MANQKQVNNGTSSAIRADGGNGNQPVVIAPNDGALVDYSEQIVVTKLPGTLALTEEEFSEPEILQIVEDSNGDLQKAT